MDQTIKDALRLAQRPRRLHQTMSRRGYAFGGPSEQDEADTEAFLRDELKGSAPQYEPEAGLKTAKEAGLLAAGFVPGSGIASAAGKFPTAEGGFEPSLREDIGAGRYGSAALKGLGAAGDVLQAVPVVGTAAGAALKAPLAMKLATAMAPAARLAREAAPAAEAAREAVPAAREAEAATSVAGEVSIAPEMTKSQSQAAMKAAWEAGQGDTSKYKNWNHQWNMEEGPKFAAKKAEAAPAPTEVAEALPPAEAPAYQRLVNPAGFYSRAHEAAMLELPAKPRTWQEMHSLLSKAPRVQAEELYWSGIHPEVFPAGEKVSREQIADLIEKNFPKVHPEIRTTAEPPELQKLQEAHKQSQQAYNQLEDQYTNVHAQIGDPDVPNAYEFTSKFYSNRPAALEMAQSLPEELRGPASALIDQMRSHENLARELNDVRSSLADRPRPKYEQYTVPGGTDYEERILKHEYRSGDEYGANYVHPEVKEMYAPQMNEINAERKRLADEAQKARFEYKENVVKPYVENMREEYVQKLLSGDTPVTTPEELAASRAARDAADAERKQATAEYNQIYNEDVAPGDIPNHQDRLNAAKDRIRQADRNYETLQDRHIELYANSEEGVRDDVSRIAPEIIANTLGKREEMQGVRLGQSEQMANIDALYQEQEKQLIGLRDKVLQESQARVPYAPEYTQQKYAHSHWPGTENPVVHTRNSTRVGPEGEKIWHQEEMQSDWAQEGREKGFRDPKIDEAYKQYETQRSQLVSDRDAMIDENHKNYKTSLEALRKKTDEDISQAWNESFAKEQAIGGDIPANSDKIQAIRQEVVDKVNNLKASYAYDEKELQNAYHQKSEEIGGMVSQKLAELNANRPTGKSGPIPPAPYTRDTEHWLTLAAKDTLKEAIERGYDKIFITGGQEQARRWANELRKSVDQVMWEGGANGEKIVFAKPKGGGEAHRFVVQPTEGPGGKPTYKVIDSDISEAKDQSLSSVIGGDLAKRVIAEDSGNVPMKGYVMGSEGYSQTYERKAPSIYKKLIKSFDPEAKVEAGELPRGEITLREVQDVQDDILVNQLHDDIDDDVADIWRKQLDEMLSYMKRGNMSFDQAARLAGADRGLMDRVSKAVAEKPAVQGTYIQITPRMRAEYERLKQKFGAVFPAYKRGGAVDANVNASYNDRQRRFVKDALKITRRYTD